MIAMYCLSPSILLLAERAYRVDYSGRTDFVVVIVVVVTTSSSSRRHVLVVVIISNILENVH